MSSLEALCKNSPRRPRPGAARSYPLGRRIAAEVARVMQICNACRYCGGFCAVFPAMTRRLEFQGRRALPGQPVPQLRRLPARLPVRAAARVCRQRRRPWSRCAARPTTTTPGRPALGTTVPQAQWPDAVAGPGGRLTLFLALAAALRGGWCAVGNAHLGASLPPVPAQPDGGHVCAHLPCLWCWRCSWACGVSGATSSPPPAALDDAAASEAAHDVLRLKYLDGGHGEGCHNEDDAFSLTRRAPPPDLLRLPAVLCRQRRWPRCTTMPWLGGACTTCPASPRSWVRWAAPA